MKKYNKYILIFGYFLLALLGTSCGGGGGGGGPAFPVFACTNTADDSQSDGNNNIVSIINSAFVGSPTYGAFIGPREGDSGFAILDYMVHEPAIGTTPKNTLLVLIAGGQLTAGIASAGGDLDIASDGGSVGFAGGNFLVRSAHLFTYRGYRVLTIDRPSDAADFLDPNRPSDTHGSALDVLYRTRVQHAVDLSAMINRVNTSNHPVVILGTSRGGISAVAQHKLGAAIAISNPVSSGSNGDPVSSTNAAQVTSPAHVLWHINDGCIATQPTNSQALVSAFANGDGNAVSGGFEPAGTNLCGAFSHHGFLGIESCAVSKSTEWIDNELTTLPTPRPLASPVPESTPMGIQKVINLTGAAMGTSLTYSLPHTETSLGGTVSIASNMVTYTPPAGVSGKTDTFVYVVTESGGGTSHNIVSVTLTP